MPCRLLRSHRKNREAVFRLMLTYIRPMVRSVQLAAVLLTLVMRGPYIQLFLMLMTVMMLIAAIKITYVGLKDIWAAMVCCGLFCQFIRRSFSFCFLFLILCYVRFMKWLDCVFNIIILNDDFSVGSRSVRLRHPRTMSLLP